MSEVLYFILTIGILVFIHEFGHFAAAKFSGMRVDAFAIGFGYRLFGWNKLKGFSFGELPKDFDGEGNTDYRLCLLPLGGYVKIAGMVDESADVSFADKEPQPYEFRAKSTPKKVFVITAGVAMNLLLAIAIFWSSEYTHGKKTFKTTTLGYVQNTAAINAGFRADDKILRINGKAINDLEGLQNEIFVKTLGKDLSIAVERNGSELTLQLPRKSIPQAESSLTFFYFKEFKTVIDTTLPGSPAAAAGLQKHDTLLAIDDIPLFSRLQTIEILTANKGRQVTVKVLRHQHDTVALAATPDAYGKLGVGLVDIYTGAYESKNYSLFEAFNESIKDMASMTQTTFVMFKRVITNEVEFKSVFGGPIKIAQYAAKSANSGLSSFIMFLAYLSLSLAIINILPIPALDGGHLVMILVERVMRREIPIKVKIAIQNTGMVLLLALMAFIIYNDLRSTIGL
jgi:regulator of sigma E protease